MSETTTLQQIITSMRLISRDSHLNEGMTTVGAIVVGIFSVLLVQR